MYIVNTKCILFFVIGFFLSIMTVSALQGKKTLTIADEIGLIHFGDPYTGQAEEVQFSPDGEYFAVDTERGRLDLNRVDDSLSFYRSKDVTRYLERSDKSQLPFPIWVANRFTGKEGPIIKDWRWLSDSSGVAFLERTIDGNERLVLADIRKQMIEPLTSAGETVKAFDVRDRQHYVFTATNLVERKQLQNGRRAPAIIVTGHSLWDLLLPDDQVAVRQSLTYTTPILWAVVDGKRFEVKHDGIPIVSSESLALSPDGTSLVTVMPVPEVPVSWETLYPPSYASSVSRIQAGHKSAHQYVQINLRTGSVQSLTEAPLSNDAGWWAFGNPSWSSDGQAILLPGTFLRSKDNLPSRPCLAIVDLFSSTRTCVWRIKARTGPGPRDKEEGYNLVIGARFTSSDKGRLTVTFQELKDGVYGSLRTIEHRLAADGTWQVAGQSEDLAAVGRNGLRVAVEQGLNEPPRLVASNEGTSRVIWDPNPQLKNLDLGQASVYTWKDKEGKQRKGGLFKPSDYKAGQRYPLVIQTHGFSESQFLPSGVYPTAFAARALSTSGIFVLQVGEVGDCSYETPDEGPCNAAGYETVAKQLVSEGLVDPERIGIIGFSRTCFHVMETLTSGSNHFKAASITDGIMGGYPEYLFFEQITKSFDSIMGAKPFGEGLQQWLKRSPGFNLDKVTAPLLVVGAGPHSLLYMWEPYAGLRDLNKPVELMMLNTDEHVLSNPAVRMASQGGSVDWFRFWLQDYEDPDHTKAEQYARWRDLRKLQLENESRLRTPQPASN